MSMISVYTNTHAHSLFRNSYPRQEGTILQVHKLEIDLSPKETPFEIKFFVKKKLRYVFVLKGIYPHHTHTITLEENGNASL